MFKPRKKTTVNVQLYGLRTNRTPEGLSFKGILIVDDVCMIVGSSNYPKTTIEYGQHCNNDKLVVFEDYLKSIFKIKNTEKFAGLSTLIDTFLKVEGREKLKHQFQF